MSRVTLVLTTVIALLIAKAGAQDKAERKAEKAEAKAANAANAEPAAKAEGFEAFKNARTKNIFDPSRRGLRTETPSNAAPPSATNRSRSLALTGTMVTDGKALAFFGGTAAEGSRVLSVGSSVANYKVTAIAPTQVSLEHDGKTIVLEVGRQITFEGGSSAPAAPGAIVEAPHEPAADTTGAPSVPGAAGDKADILRRMMERRAKEGGR